LVTALNKGLDVLQDGLEVTFFLFTLLTLEDTVGSVDILEAEGVLLFWVFVPLEDAHDALDLLELVVVNVDVMGNSDEGLMDVLDGIPLLNIP
jgi:hypothetical protein